MNFKLWFYALRFKFLASLLYTKYDKRYTLLVVCEKKYNYFQKKEGFFKKTSYIENSVLFLTKYVILKKTILN